MALEMLFATPLLMHNKITRLYSFYDETWLKLWDNRHRLVSKKADAFIGYAYQQASKYGIRGSRVAAVKKAIDLFMCFMKPDGSWQHVKLGDYEQLITSFAKTTEHCDIIDIPLTGQGKIVRHLEVCNRKVPFTTSVKEAYSVFNRLYDAYGERARQAERNEGIDWKALSHAVRVGTMSRDYLKTGVMELPCPNAKHLLDIKRGLLSYAEVAEEIETLIGEVKNAAATSTLPEEPDTAWCDSFIVETYGEKVLHGLRPDRKKDYGHSGPYLRLVQDQS
jgi:hypothetical protein